MTGGGIAANTNRILPEHCSIEIDWNAWQRPPIFDLVQDLGSVPEDDMRRTFNLGVGLVIVVRPDRVEEVQDRLEGEEEAFPIGRVRDAHSA